MDKKNKTAGFPDVSRRGLLKLIGGGSLAAVALSAPRKARAETSGGTPVLSLQTRLTSEYGIQYPFVGAGMGFVSVPALVAAVSNAGGLGVFGNAVEPPPSTQLLIQQIKALTDKPFGVDFIPDDSAFGPVTTDDHIAVCVAEGVKLVIFHLNLPPQRWVDTLHAAGAKVWMQAASVELATGAVAMGIDAIVAQGSQAGGHNRSTTRTIKLLHEIKAAVPPGTLVLAAGGIADGAKVVEALANGADGVWVGTRLVASTEAYAHDEYKRRIIAAGGHATATTTMFGPEYPGRPYRVLRNRVVNEFAGKEDQIPDPPPPPAVIGETVLFPLTFRVPYTMPKFSVIVPTPDTTGDFEEMGLPAGEDSVKVIKDIKPAAEIVASMMAEAQQIIAEEQLGSGG